ncbi:MAG: catalase [Burkholderiaceae bacterium]
MATSKPTSSAKPERKSSGSAAAKSSASGPSHRDAAASADRLSQKAADTDKLASAMPYNAIKANEYGHEHAIAPSQGQTESVSNADVAASTVSEANASGKTGAPPTQDGAHGNDGSLTHVRANSGAQYLTTNQGVAIGDNQNSLKAGLRGPTLLEDFILREKITHFDHERIPERIVHARGSAAHGYFECYKPLTEITRAAPFQAAGKRTPVFVRFSTVAGERGSTDTARDIRGFAVKFYTDEGNWDLVGNNIPVFFIQDAMKFPDLIHAVKPEPHNAIPQAASAHDTFWDFISLMPEATHVVTWVMSDRGIPRSLRMMQGFGVHTFRLVNDAGESVFCKFHWKPLLGTHSLVWDEAVKISGADSDFHRRDLWEAIEAGEYPEWELGLQIFTEEQADGFSFDVLDATKIVPEELVPLMPVGRMVLNRNPDNFFAETEQVAFCTAHIVPGIDFSNDPLLAGRIHSYVDTQISRLGGANFHETPTNEPLTPTNTNQRDGMHRQTIARGRVAYEPNSLAGGCPFQAGTQGFVSFPERITDDKVRGKAEKFADHYTQATLFYNSQTEQEKAHIVGGFRFELSKVTVPAIRERMVSSLVNVSPELAVKVAEGLGIDVPPAMPKAISKDVVPEVELSPALSLTHLPGDGGIRTRRIAMLVAEGSNLASIDACRAALKSAGGVPLLVAPRLGTYKADGKGRFEADASMENAAPVLFDALIVVDGDAAIDALEKIGNTMEFVKDQYRHGKTMMMIGAARRLLDKAGIAQQLPDGSQDPGLIVAGSTPGSNDIKTFIEALARHRHPERDMDPPLI